ncbi:MAG: macro domain-containing protein [Planctomycetota bacterium]|nr:macro domain-containing protein [Planctomycetota bacterium]
MIHYVEGDILLTKAEATAHGISPNDPFEQGLARALREKYPLMFKDYRHYAHQSHPKPGEIWEWGGFGVRLFNLLTQEGSFEHGSRPGRATLANVSHCLKRLRHELEKQKIGSLALPRLATGVGGLDWSDVMPVVEKQLGDLQTHVYVYATYRADVSAQETVS